MAQSLRASDQLALPVDPGGGPGAVDSMNITSSSLLATCRYNDIVPQPNRSASRAIDSGGSPSAPASAPAAETIRSRVSPLDRRDGAASPHRISRARGSGSSRSFITGQRSRYTARVRMTYAIANDIRIHSWPTLADAD